jgi:hypothetical protein
LFQDLPFDILEIIYKKIHVSYMDKIEDELFIFHFRKENNLGDDFDEEYN